MNNLVGDEPTDDELLRSLVCTAMMRLGTRMAMEFDKRFAQFSLTQAQFRVLLIICQEGREEGIAPSALADRLLIERSTASVLTNRMVERGWLVRRSGENRRTFRLMLTASGTQTLQAVLPHAVAAADATLAAIALDDLRPMLASLTRVEAHLRAGRLPPGQEEDHPGAADTEHFD